VRALGGVSDFSLTISGDGDFQDGRKSAEREIAMSWSDGRWRRAICDNRARVAIKKGFRKKKQSVWSSVQKKSSPAKQTGPQTQVKTKTPKALMSNVDASYLGRR
jgi:hypothetical protein